MSGVITTYPAVLAYEVALNTAPDQVSVPPLWTDVSARTKFPWSLLRGRQYELDTNPSGELRIGLENKDGALDPSNTASPYTPGIVPYRGCRIRAQASSTANLLRQQIATGTASINPVSDTAANWFYPSTGSVAQATNLLAAPTGATTAAAWTSPPGTTSSAPLYAGVVATGAPDPAGPVADCVQVTAGSQYTSSVYLMRASSADATVQVSAAIRWYSTSGTVLSSSSGTAASVAAGSWVRAAVTATAPAGAVWGRPRFAITTPASTTATNTVYATGWQFEQAASASTWTDPGTTYFIYSGLVERWPQTWQHNGTYGYVDAVAVDSLAALAQYTLQPPFIEEVLAAGPDFLYPLNDPVGSTSCADASASRPPAPVESAPSGVGSLTFGSSITSTNPSSGFVGTPGPVATFANTATGPGTQTAETYIALHKTTVAPGPPAAPWTRMIAFRTSSVPGTAKQGTVWCALPPNYGASNQSQFLIQINATGQLVIQTTTITGTGLAYTSAGTYTDGNWHQVAVVVTGLLTTFYVDGASASSSAGSFTPTGIGADVIGCSVQPGSSSYGQGFTGDVAHAAEFPTALTAAQITNLYTSWRTASSGESSGARAARVLKWVGYTGATAIDSGQTQQMGPATDLTGATALDALNAIALTEAGNFFAANTGALTFTSRTRRYNQAVPTFTFGENTANGEWPYESISLDYDPTHLFNTIQTTHYSSGQVATAIDTASVGTYFPRILQRTINPLLYTEAADASAYLLQQYKSARQRVADLTLHPSAVAGLFAVCLQLEIGTRIRVMRRPPSLPGAVAIQIDCFVESVAWDLDPGTGDVTVRLQCSPADLASYWVLAAMHTTLHAQATAGASSISINALLDAAVNPLAASMPQNQQLTLEPGTPRAETVTVVPPLPATNPGYSNATLNVTPNLAFTHALGTTACEPLPAGVTDPTTYDTQSVLGALSTSFAVAASSGANTITVNAPADGKTNALGSDLSTGDLLWLSPGTPQFEGYNVLHPNVATAGEGALPLAAGMSGAAWGLASDVGTPTVTASGSAQQGANVWAVSVAGGVVPTKGLMYVLKVPVTAGLAYTASEYVRSATTGANPTVQMYIKFSDATGTALSQTNSGTTVLTGGPSAAWTRMTVTATAPANTVWAQVGLLLTATAPAGAWTWQADALQLEQAASASAFQVCPQVLLVATSYPGYSTCVITLNQNLTQNHAINDVVCDPLPPGDTAPSQIAATTRIAY